MSRQREALQILANYPNANAATFAEFFWSGARRHTKPSHQDPGSSRVESAQLAGASYLGKLSKKGLVWVDFHGGSRHTYRLTAAGMAEITASPSFFSPPT